MVLLTATTLVDARWANNAGTTNFTRALLQGLAEVDPPGRWLLWGPPSMIDGVWPRSIGVPTSIDPAEWFGQRSAMRVPRADLVLHPHQTRPLHRFPAASCILDLIQLRHPVAPVRIAMGLRLRASVRAARVLFTIASTVRDELASDFGVDAARVTVLRLPVDAKAAARVAAQRESASPERVLLSIGRFDRHKNLRRLVQAFQRTRFAATGGRLHLIGGTAAQLDLGGDALPPGVHVMGVLNAAGLEAAMVGATALIQASVVEGYGLPVAEALMAGLPVVSSPVPAVSEFGPSGVPTFDPYSLTAISEAIDETINLVEAGLYWGRVGRDVWLANQPSPRTLASQVLAGLASAQ